MAFDFTTNQQLLGKSNLVSPNNNSLDLSSMFGGKKKSTLDKIGGISSPANKSGTD